MKFVADSMLGRLARWLRLLGHDTSYYPHIKDSLLLEIADKENRTILTRDTRLVRRKIIRDFLLLHENDSFEQLKEVVDRFDLLTGEMVDAPDDLPVLYRCILCNSVLDNASKDEAKQHVPPYVYNTINDFKRCVRCDKYYWNGTHPERIRKKLLELFS